MMNKANKLEKTLIPSSRVTPSHSPNQNISIANLVAQGTIREMQTTLQTSLYASLQTMLEVGIADN